MSGANRSLKPSEPSHNNRLSFALQAAGIGTWTLDNLHQQIWCDERCRELYGLSGGESVPYEQLVACIHPDDRLDVDIAIQRAINPQSGGTYYAQFRTREAKTRSWRWLRCKGRAFFSETGTAYQLTGVVEAIAPTTNIAGNLIEEAPIATGLYVGRALIVEQANEAILKIWGKDATVIGKPLADALPELQGQPFLDILEDIFATGKAFTAQGMPCDLVVDGTLRTFYFDFTYKPLRNDTGEIYAIMNMAVDVTEQVLAHRQLEAIQADLLQTTQRLGLALEAGSLGSYELDLATGLMNCTPQCKINYGQPIDVPFNLPDLMHIIMAEDRSYVEQAITQSIEKQTAYMAEYRIIWPDQSLHWVRASGRPTHFVGGKPTKMTGVTQEITAQRQLQLVLEQQVQERTEELEATNEELSATNEELASTNEELIEANQNLTRSNENLEQFAYIASHDLQEPLRKIQQFGDLLKTRYADPVGEELVYLERMQSAASRMSVLIKDLLTFSRISTRQASTSPVALSLVVKEALENLSVAIEETSASIQVEPLPSIQGDNLQLVQLFQNLLSNSLKFHRTDESGALVPPIINIRTSQVAVTDLPVSLKPARSAAAYYCIAVSDNGIGFDERYIDRIFQVFQRLHGKKEFAGTGVGLAICQKVATNHGGAISAISQPGKGATFSVYFPVPI
ncbi:PAS domain-containing protein [Spirosoma sp. KNUC1025]|uniref:PAS domain-containing protein n=1 Tax=Spirosoma sp. KNUC1025 TaxID=2894082 RepID=UPI00386C95FD|nr:PAS domain-containing protein [Spirosoma sp. KNUC1025]